MLGPGAQTVSDGKVPAPPRCLTKKEGITAGERWSAAMLKKKNEYAIRGVLCKVLWRTRR